MFIIHLLKKLILIPLLVMVTLLNLACLIAGKLAVHVVGPLMTFVILCDVYCLYKSRMQDVLILSLILLAIVLGTIFAVTLQDSLERIRKSLSNRISN